MSKLSGVLICVPAYGHSICMETAESLFCLAQFMCLNKIPHQLTYMGAADIEEVRNMFLTSWYDGSPQSSHLLFIDTDMHFNPPLIRDMLAFDKPLVGSYYAKRQHPAEAVGKSLSDDVLSDVKHGFLKVAAVGCGITLIRRDMIDTMLEKMPHIIETDPKAIAGHPCAESIKAFGGKRIIRAFDKMRDDDGAKLSEDMSFCKRWRDCGGEVWANVEHLVGHIGRFNYAIRYADYLETKARDAKAAA